MHVLMTIDKGLEESAVRSNISNINVKHEHSLIYMNLYYKFESLKFNLISYTFLKKYININFK